MTGPDYPDWHQPVTDVMLQTTVFSGTIAAFTTGAALDVSRYESVIVFTQATFLVADFTFDQAGTQLIQELRIPGGGFPLVCVAPWLTLTNSTAGVANVTVIGTNRRIDQSQMYNGTNQGWFGTATATMAIGDKLTMLTTEGTLPFGSCQMYVEISGSVVLGFLTATPPSGRFMKIWDSNRIASGAAPLGRTDAVAVAIPPITQTIDFICEVAGTATVQVYLYPNN